MPTAVLRRRGKKLVAISAIAVASVFVSASVASALSARTYGFQCSSQYHWVRQNWPNIRTDSSKNVDVWMYTTLYKWTASGWRAQRSSQWFNGVSNNQGHKVLDLGFGSEPIYWVYYQNGTKVAPEMGYVFKNLKAGYYATVETFSVNGRRWTSAGHEFVAGTTNVSDCRA